MAAASPPTAGPPTAGPGPTERRPIGIVGDEIRTLVEDDLPQLLTLRRLSFNMHDDPDDPAVLRRFRPRLPHTRGLFVDGRLQSAVSWFPYRMFLGRRSLEQGALAGVVSAPEARRRGRVRALLLHGFAELRQRGVGWSLEHPFDPRFYARLGYQSVGNGHLLTLPVSRLPQGRGPEAVRVEAGELHRLKRIHRAFASRWSFALARDWRPPGLAGGSEAPQWRRLLRSPGSARERFAYLLDDAYLIADLQGFGDDGTLEVEDAAWASAAGRARLLEFLGSFAGQVGRVQLHLPPHDPLTLDWAPRFHHERPVLQARVVDVRHALEPLTLPAWAAERTLTLVLRDDACAWNEGRWTLELTHSGVRVAHAAATAASDGELDVRALVSLLAGVPPEALLAEGRAAGDVAALRSVAALTAGQPPFLSTADFF